MTSEPVISSNIESSPVGAQFPPVPGCTGPDGTGDLAASTSIVGTLDVLLRMAWMAFEADGAGVLLVGDDGAASTAASGADARRAHALQISHRQGPGLHAITGRQPVVSAELRFDGRWRLWAPEAADLGFRSALSLTLFDGDSFGALTLYSESPSNFGTDSLAPGLEFARQASLAIAAALRRERILKATVARGIVGQAPSGLTNVARLRSA